MCAIWANQEMRIQDDANFYFIFTFIHFQVATDEGVLYIIICQAKCFLNFISITQRYLLTIKNWRINSCGIAAYTCANIIHSQAIHVPNFFIGAAEIAGDITSKVAGSIGDMINFLNHSKCD